MMKIPSARVKGAIDELGMRLKNVQMSPLTTDFISHI